MRRIGWPILIALSSGGAYAVTFPSIIPYHDPATMITTVRPEIIMWFLFVCPGLAIVPFFRLVDPAVKWMLTLALSFTIDACVASIILYAHRWSPVLIVEILLLFCVLGALVQLLVLPSLPGEEKRRRARLNKRETSPREGKHAHEEKYYALR